MFSVISNPLTLPDFGAGTYKLTSAGGHVQGTVSSDAVASIAGTVGRSADRDPAPGGRARGRRRRPRGHARLAAGRRALARLRRRPVASRPRSAPHRASSSCSATSGRPRISMCFRVKLAGRRKTLGYCNPYFDAFTPLDDLIEAASLVDAFDLPPPTIERAAVSIRARRGREVRRADLRAGAPPGGRREARAGAGDRAAPQRRAPHAQRSGAHPARPAARPAHAGPDRHERWRRLARGELPARVRRRCSERVRRRRPSRARSASWRVASPAFTEDVGISARIRRGDERLVYRSDDVSFEGRLRVRLAVRRARR